MIPEFWQLVEDLPKAELIDLLNCYDVYIQEANDEDKFHEGWRPVCIAEFYANEYQMILAAPFEEG